jgi:hypothetical protein
MAGWWFFPYTPVSYTNKTNRHDITEILLKVWLKRNCIIARKKIIVIFQENIISRRLTTKTSVNGILYMVVDEVYQLYVDVCSGQLIVTCVVGHEWFIFDIRN